MANPPYHASPGYILTEQDKERLDYLAEKFAVLVVHLPVGRIRLTVPALAGPQDLELPAERGYLRLLMELCSITARWLYFKQDEHCAITLLNQTDSRLDRLAQLYRQWVADGCPEQAVTQLPASSRARRLA